MKLKTAGPLPQYFNFSRPGWGRELALLTRSQVMLILLVLGPEARVSSGTLLEMQNLKPELRPTNPNLHFEQAPKKFVCSFKFEKHRP